ncbi:MAG: hypothetical protein HQK55_08815, partial [Deltaproteobacteria bacterium]|nr:hypothetical protein [Deltaproteobacteria bacterium]
MTRLFKTNLCLVIILGLIVFSVVRTYADGVPEEYLDLYNALEAKLTEAEGLVGNQGSAFQPTFAVELTAANGNRGSALLPERVRQGIKVYMDTFQKLGVTGVTVTACFPMFLKEFPHAAEYLDFYKFVVNEARIRGLKVLFKISEAFRDRERVYGHLPVGEFYHGLTPERFMQQKREMIEIVLRELEPDYLTVANEPDTSAMNTGLDFSPDHYIQYVQAFTKNLSRGRTKIGAGAGSWSPREYWQRLASETEVDYLDMHIYPIN